MHVLDRMSMLGGDGRGKGVCTIVKAVLGG